MAIAIRIENVSKQYRLGEVGTGTLSHDLHRAWAKIRGKPDPFAKVGQINDRTQKLSVGIAQSANSPNCLLKSENAVDADYTWALKDVSFDVQQGEVLGIIGRNGAGKSTLLKLLSRVTAPTTGSIKAKGRISSLLEVGTGFHPELTGRENIYLNGAILGMHRHEISNQLDAIVDFSGCAKYIDTPVKRYSSGMMVRLGFAVAAHLECETLVVDEVLAVGDAEFQKKCIGKMKQVASQLGRTVMFVSHNMGSVMSLCTRACVLINGGAEPPTATEVAIRQYLNLNEHSSGSETSAHFLLTPSSPFQFHSIAMCNSDGQQITKCSINDSVRIDLTYECRQLIPGLEIAVALFNSYGTRLFTTERSQHFTQQISLGMCSESVVIPADTFVAGEYSVTVAAFLPNSQIFQSLKDVVRFSAFDDGFHFSRYAGADIGVVQVACGWSTKPPE
ncbi:ABC transporter ATP-binding protein [Allorhodopirellula heiligendammensis]|uniref:Teichoic acids export ATP-binding protein TagH n=1 Tax=Allorhodopirellula heiligendammensis TaxID=2714739 RepID=A0A5C6C2B3_9BACT|nr:ABC transporter ATP-binding protein [Allorhodopirellula heiligendammensis]TWU16979.1 Teichoic acids export ATP-binding protein TagH [Allorhodopirellula heiligendammensis]